MSKPKLGYLLFDLPSDHEVERALATEYETIAAIISNRGMHARVKRVPVASIERFMNYPTYRYGVQFVHLARHGGRQGIGMLGGVVGWGDVAKQIVKHLHPLKRREQRVMCFSCCHSFAGFKATKNQFSSYFTGAYHSTSETIPFAKAITTWTMFYLKKKLSNPHEAIVKSINDFMGEDVLQFRRY
jgi:hypothetical protein